MPRRKAHPHIVEGLRARLRAALDSREWSVADLRQRLKERGVVVSAGTPHEWVTRGVIPDAYVLLMVCDLLGIRYRWALTGEGEMQLEADFRTRRAGTDEAKLAQLTALERMAEFIEAERTRLTGGSRDGAAARTVAAALPGAGGPRRRRPAAGE